MGSPKTKAVLSFTDAGTDGGSVFAVQEGPRSCTGDCNSDGRVTVDEILTMVAIALGSSDLSACGSGDADQEGQISIDEILTAVPGR